MSPQFKKKNIKIFTLGTGKQIYCKIKLNDVDRWTLIDPGAGISVIESSLVTNIRTAEMDYEITTAKGDPITLLGYSRVRVEIGQLRLETDIVVCSDLKPGVFLYSSYWE